ncbi:MAG: acetyl-CoA carboxylase biotin carboxyl carrier protein subunit [Gammaproteobacteria bacterium]|jgi:biotin carboxyl carrier protein
MKLRITLDGVTYDLDVEFLEEGGEAIPVRPSAPSPKGASKPAGASSPAPKPAAPLPEGADKTITSPLSGTVFKLLVKVGDSVESNQDLLILEAMKMETNIVAAGPGTIKNIHVAEGDAVTQGQLLMEFE